MELDSTSSSIVKSSRQLPPSTDRSSTWTLRDLPAHLSEIRHHPKAVQYSLFSDESKISPTWTKVTETPWIGRAKLLGGGIGRKIKSTTISNDAPTFFVNPERVPNAQLKPVSKKKMMNESAYVLPGGTSCLLQRPEHGNRYRTFFSGKETYLEPLITERYDGKSGRSARDAGGWQFQKEGDKGKINSLESARAVMKYEERPIGRY